MDRDDMHRSYVGLRTLLCYKPGREHDAVRRAATVTKLDVKRRKR